VKRIPPSAIGLGFIDAERKVGCTAIRVLFIEDKAQDLLKIP
jgi:hypothetical protein